jgi:hypothetical protein
MKKLLSLMAVMAVLLGSYTVSADEWDWDANNSSMENDFDSDFDFEDSRDNHRGDRRDDRRDDRWGDRRDNRGQAQCRSRMVTRRGRTLRSFMGFGRNKQQARRKAMRKCRKALKRRQNDGRNRMAECRVTCKRRGGRNMVIRSCGVDRVTRRGRTIQTHVAQARGPRGTGVKQKACNKARKQCQRNRVRAQRCLRR